MNVSVEVTISRNFFL